MMKKRSTWVCIAAASLASLALFSCAPMPDGDADNSTIAVDNSTIAADEVAASMSTEAGAVYSIAADLGEATGTAMVSPDASANSEATGTAMVSRDVSANSEATVVITAGQRSFSVEWYDSLDGTGALLGTTPGTIPPGTKSAVISSTRMYAIDGSSRSGTTTINASTVVNNIADTAGTWDIKASLQLERDMTLASGTAVSSSILHSIDWSVSVSTGAIESGGTAMTSATLVIGGGKSLTWGYSWAFLGNGTSILTSDRGATLTVIVE